MLNRALPYFDFLLAELERLGSPAIKSFGKHVHWGYWANPSNAQQTHDDFYVAAENLTKKICTIVQIGENQAVLDVGCGFGGTISLLNKQYSNMNLTGLNIDGRQLIRAKNQVTAGSTNRINFVEGDACKLPFPDNHFDKILAVECIFHFPDRKSFFQEVCRVLKPGGCMALSDFIPNPLLLPHCWIMSKPLVMRWPLVNKFNFFGYCNLNYTLRRYRRLAVLHDLEMEVCDITKNVYPTYGYLSYLFKSMQLAESDRRMADAFVRGMQLLSKSALLKYQILSFKKPLS
jgi:ubiquinone/menaquinone biosynthesis C-methylase UbiE